MQHKGNLKAVNSKAFSLRVTDRPKLIELAAGGLTEVDTYG